MTQSKNNRAIKVESLSKIYPLYKSPNDRLKEALHPLRKKYHKEFYALRNISFEVERGDSLGIIGQNGSGKSTLVKILSRVLTPSSGSFDIRGRVISLLELGAGFNPELTGLENIYFYGTILGFSKKMVDERLDVILAYADIGEFIYQPLKTYSSGMRARLAFSVASHVNPDILILDEVLAVGDLRFKQKCLRTMRDIIDSKRTVLFVSHDMGAVTSFCNKTLWIKGGKIEAFGDSSDIVKKYVGFMTYGLETDKPNKKQVSESASNEDEKKPTGDDCKQKKLLPGDIKWVDVSKHESFGEYGAVIEKVALYFRDTETRVVSLKGGEWLSLYARINTNKLIERPGLGIRFKDKRGNGIFTVNNYLYNISLRSICKGETFIIQTDFKLPLLINGKYAVTVALTDGNQLNHTQHHWIHDAMLLEVNSSSLPSDRRGNMICLDPGDYHVHLYT